MNEQATSQEPGRVAEPISRPLNVVLNTWFLLKIHQTSPGAQILGGLPNDFLTRGAASLLILDHVVCDEGGLATEAAMPWVSSHIFKTLRAENLLRPEPLQLKYSSAVFRRLEETGLLPWARKAMHEELVKIKQGDLADEELRLPSTLRWLNSVMFTGVDLPDVLHYDYQENHFSALSLAAQQLTSSVTPHIVETEIAEDQVTRASRLFAVLSMALPDFTLLPPIGSKAAKEALKENIRKESRMMYRYVYGDFPHSKYEQFRSGEEFRLRDSVIDNAQRFREADRNLELLLRVRSKTASVRPHAQQVIHDVVNGERSLEEVRSELDTVRSTIEDALEHETKARDLHIVAGAKVLLGAVEALTGHLGPAALSFAEVAHAFREASEVRRRHAELGREFPLAWIAGLYTRERKKR
jgi:hypothetical protein